MAISREKLIEGYSKAIQEGTAAIFAGAGFSRPNGYVDWKGLLRPLGNDIGLDVDRETDLLSVAQYCRNRSGSRSVINDALVKSFSDKVDVDSNENAKILARLPIKTYWTTNYDHVIEESLRAAGRIADIKAETDQLQLVWPNRDAIVYKMHGDVSKPTDAVLTKEDYELYDTIRSKFREVLTSDLISKQFLFIGFSFSDPNISFLLGEIKKAFHHNPKTHYSFSRRVQSKDYADPSEYRYALLKQDLQVEDLCQYGIQTVYVNEFSEITDILKQIELKTRLKRVFISGSANEYSGFWDSDHADTLVAKLTKALIKEGYIITSGFGFGIGSTVITSAIEEIYASKGGNIDKHLCLYPFPQNIVDPMKKAAQRKKYRENMIRSTGVSIFLFGNKKDPGTKAIINSPGCMEEYSISKANGNIVIPIGTTGYAAKEISDMVKTDISSFPYLTGHLSVLDSSTDIDKLIDTVLKILDE